MLPPPPSLFTLTAAPSVFTLTAAPSVFTPTAAPSVSLQSGCTLEVPAAAVASSHSECEEFDRIADVGGGMLGDGAGEVDRPPAASEWDPLSWVDGLAIALHEAGLPPPPLAGQSSTRSSLALPSPLPSPFTHPSFASSLALPSPHGKRTGDGTTGIGCVVDSRCQIRSAQAQFPTVQPYHLTGVVPPLPSCRENQPSGSSSSKGADGEGGVRRGGSGGKSKETPAGTASQTGTASQSALQDRHALPGRRSPLHLSQHHPWPPCSAPDFFPSDW